MLKNTRMRILAITFAFSLVACVDQVTPVGVDDIEEDTDDSFGPGTLKGDVGDVARPTIPDSLPQTQLDSDLLQIQLTKQPLPPAATALNPVPRR